MSSNDSGFFGSGGDAELDSLFRPLRIAIVTENFLPKVDGVTRTIARLLDVLRAEGHEAILLGPKSDIKQYAGHEIVGTRGIPLYFYPGLSLNFFPPSFITKVRGFDPDVIHYVDPIWLSAQAQICLERALPEVAAVASYHTNLARYASMYGFGWLVGTMWRLQGRLLNACEATYCPSPSTRSMLNEHGINNVELWPRGIDTKLFNPSKRCVKLRSAWSVQTPSGGGNHKLVILYVGRISHEKNLPLLFQAFRGLQEAAKAARPDFPGCKLVLVGDGPARESMERKVGNADVHFAGYRGGDDLATHFASADLFGFPSHSETFGNVVLEAMASGLPVVGLRAEGVRDLVKHEINGLLLELPAARDLTLESTFRPGSATFNDAVVEYRKLLVRMCVDDKFRAECHDEAMAFAKTKSWDAAMECMLTGYRKAAESTVRRRMAKLQTTLSRFSSTASLRSEASFIDVRVEEPPEGDTTLSSAMSSARLLFGRPPIKGLLRRSTRQALKQSISLKLQASRDTYLELMPAKRPELHGWQIVIFCLLLGLLWTARSLVPSDLLR